MKKSKYYNGFWLGLTVVLSVVFAILFFPVVSDRYSLPISILFTAVGIAFIWVIYFVRALIFGSPKKQ